MTVIVESPRLPRRPRRSRRPRPGGAEPQARRSSVRKRFAMAAVVAAAMIVGVLGWRWALVEATTDYGPGPDSLTVEPAVRPVAKQAPPTMELEVTVLDVHTAPAPPAAARAPLKPAAAAPARPRPRSH